MLTNLASDTEASLTYGTPGKTKRPFYSFLFNLKVHKQIWLKTAADTAQYLNTTEWDIAVSCNYNSKISACGIIVKVDTDYGQVTDAPSDQTFAQSTITKVGRAASAVGPDGIIIAFARTLCKQ
ncbi:hypothetical protein [Mucilaginibacter pedocola]|uniref:Uncharacterized protein n=1 Tax=Mucilaginibacter pedocola TaxID=1792845 RepID=A0A1S9PFK3_9SPHI|nr:hypothetical protein [Mucilaginibacter pedocola]OOQ59743.1 hypothetical protein BC343_06165 [Mucilaginibacter pedocola]